MKYIFITGGVVSSLGKGLMAGAIGALLEIRKLSIQLQKFDPYLNVDPGTMSPFQHGEVYVLNDGTETDLDLGHYERFTNTHLTKLNSLTSGQIYANVSKKERLGLFLGKTVQVIPHVTNEIKARIYQKNKNIDVVITEIGGTVGDIEGLPFLEAIRQFSLEVGKENVLFIHVTLLPYLKAAGELKTKPSQQSVAKLREIGIQPDILVCRTEYPITNELREKLSMFCNVPLESVIEEKDVDQSVYELPINLKKEKLDDLIIKKLSLNAPTQSIDLWLNILKKLKNPHNKVSIAVVGKYIKFKDAYKSIYEALIHAGINNYSNINLVLIDAESITKSNLDDEFKNIDGLIIPGGFGSRGIEGKILAAQYARINFIPYLGICLGMQIAAIEFARNVLNLDKANSDEFNVNTQHPIISIMKDQKETNNKGATMRLGAYSCNIKKNSIIYSIYKKEIITERHRHRYEFNSKYLKSFENNGFMAVGVDSLTNLIEILELKNHPWYIGVQFHPEFLSKPYKAHPLFCSFVRACLDFSKNKTN